MAKYNWRKHKKQKSNTINFSIGNITSADGWDWTTYSPVDTSYTIWTSGSPIQMTNNTGTYTITNSAITTAGMTWTSSAEL